MLEIRLLGQFELRLDGAPVALPSRAGQSLLAYLALNAGTALRREMLAGLLWPDASEANARRSLRQALWRLREALGRTYIEADDIGIALNTKATHWLDTERLQDDAGDDLERLLAAAGAYGGDLLPGFYDEWVVPERERLRAVYERKMQSLLDRLRAEARWTDCAAWAERWIAHGGAPEPAFRALMEAQARLNDVSAMVATYQRCVEALRRELGVAPSGATVRLFEALRAGLNGREDGGGPPGAASAEAAPRHNLPLQLTSFVGREREVAEVRRLLGAATVDPIAIQGQPRLLTLTGPAGTGKTRLALEAAAGLLDTYPDGVWLVELAPVADPERVGQAAADALAVREEPGRALKSILQAHLRDKSLLLLLDNCEHLIDACARLAEDLLRASPSLRILATSRESLGIAGESALRVPSLTFPGPQAALHAEALVQFEAVRLFVERAAAVQPDFQLSEQNGAAVAQLVARLDGIPLAIELAAARLKALSATQVAERLHDRFRLLTGGSRTALPRHQTLRAMIDWSYDLLGEPERLLLRRLAVFAGGFSLDAAEHIAADAPGEAPQALPRPEILDLLTRLVDKSLVLLDGPAGEGRARYRLLETIRQYALERLIEAGSVEAERVRARHLAYFLRLGEEAEPALRGAEQMAWLDRLEQERDNLQAALEWSTGSDGSEEEQLGQALDGLRLAGSLWRFWYLRSSRTEGRNWLGRALSAAQGAPAAAEPAAPAQPNPALARARAKALAGIGWLADDVSVEHQAYTEALALYCAAEDRWGEAFALRGLGAMDAFEGSAHEARALLERSLALFRDLEDPWGEALALFNLRWLPGKLGEGMEAGTELLMRSLELFRKAGDRWGAAVTLAALSGTERLHGNYDSATALSEDSLRLFRELGDRPGMATSLNNTALVAYRRGDYQRARDLLEQAVALNQEAGDIDGLAWCLEILGLVACYQGDFEGAEAMLERAVGIYNAMNVPDAMYLAEAFQGLLAYYQGDEARAVALWEDSLSRVRKRGDKWNMGFPLLGLGWAAMRQGQFERAGELLQESLAVSREVSEKRNEAAALHGLGRLARAMGDTDAARNLLSQSLRLRWELGGKRGMAETLDELGRLALESRGEAPARRAASLFGAAAALRERIGAPLPPVEREEYERCAAEARARQDQTEYDRLEAEGRAMSLATAVAFALEEAADGAGILGSG